MYATFHSGDIAVRPLAELKVGLGREFKIKLHEVPPGASLHWTTENDPVLDLREAGDKLSARVKATALGDSVIFIKGAEPSIRGEFRIDVKVVPMNNTSDQAVTLDGKISAEEPDPQA